MSGKKSQSAKKAAPISSHPLFPAIVALWFAALMGLGSLVLPNVLIERLAVATGLASVLPAAAPPLGMTAKLLIAGSAALLGAIMGYLLARKIGTPKDTERRAKSRKTKTTVDAKKPISAHDELGDEFDAPVKKPTGRRRSLAITDEEAPSELLTVPLPGDSAKTAKMAADKDAALVLFEDGPLPGGKKGPRAEMAEEWEEAERKRQSGSDAEDLASLAASLNRPVGATEPKLSDRAIFNPSIEIDYDADDGAAPVGPAVFRGVYNPEPEEEVPSESAADQQAETPPQTYSDAPQFSANFSANFQTGSDTPSEDSKPQMPVPAQAEPDNPLENLDEDEPLPFAAPSFARGTANVEPVPAQPVEAPAPVESLTELTDEPAEIVETEIATEEQPPEELAEMPVSEEQDEEPVTADSAGVAAKPLDALGTVELVERLALSMRKKGAKSPSVKPMPQPAVELSASEPEPEIAQEVSNDPEPNAADNPVGDAFQRILEEGKESSNSPAEVSDPAPERFEQSEVGEVPPALLPLELAFEDEADDEDEPEPDLTFRLPIGRKLEQPNPDAPFSAPAAMVDPVEPDAEQAAEAGAQPATDANNDADNPVRIREEFIRVEEPEAENGEMEAAVVFPGQAMHSEAEANSATPSEESSAETVRPFDQPATQPAPALPEGNVAEQRQDPDETDRALRSALATLQKMSGAA